MEPFIGMLPYGFLQAIGIELRRSLNGIPPAAPVFRLNHNRRQYLEVVSMVPRPAGKENEEGRVG